MFTHRELPRTIESGMIQLYNQGLKFEVSERSDSILQKHSKWFYQDPISHPFSRNSPLKVAMGSGISDININIQIFKYYKLNIEVNY